MRKANKIISMIIILLMGFQSIFTIVVSAKVEYPPDLPYHPPEQSKEELYQDIFLSLLSPYIQNEIDKYYSKYLTVTPEVAPYTVYVLSAERLNGYRTFVFNLKLKVIPFVGPHIGVGTDYITLIINSSGDVKIKKFEHIKSYELPPNYQNIVKKGYKNPIP
ncbi:DUF3888 domain-containing protein [Candidatus Clostridium stratigraminis]|uniref:DUF3888 domain-containing protein n=1 Tax=Candidatus Clostridium stratigraminis TaxID=3381661 RepID=A0ABW8T4D3_9CLOT